MPLCGRRCWVVGCGFLGSCLLAACREAGMQALGIDCEAPADVQGNAAEPAVLAAARACLEPEFIFCLAATHGGDEAAYRATYLKLPQALHTAFPSARLLFCSSSSVYGEQGGELVTEASSCRPVSAKARLLLEAEGAVLARGGSVARMVPLYGSGRCELLRRFVQREPELVGEESRVFNYIHRTDAVRALLCLAAHEQGAPRVVNVGGESFIKGEVYRALSRLTGMPRVQAAAASGRRGVVSHRISSSLLHALGWSPRVAFLTWAETHWKQMS